MNIVVRLLVTALTATLVPSAVLGAQSPAGRRVAGKAQPPLGRLAVLLLEPRSEDSLGTWGLMEDVLAQAKTTVYPVLKTFDEVVISGQ